MNIGFDLDKVFIDYPPFVPAGLIDKLYKKRDNGALYYRIPSIPEKIIRRASHIRFFRPAIKENLEFLNNIPKTGNKFYLISSRFSFLQNPTKNLIKKHNLDHLFDEMYFNFENKQPHVFKNDIIEKLNLDMYVDDDLSLIKHVAQKNPQTNFFWLNNTIKNKRLTKNIFAISTLSSMFNKP